MVYVFTLVVFCIGMFLVSHKETTFTEIDVKAKIKMIVNRNVETKSYYFRGVESRNIDYLVQILKRFHDIDSGWFVEEFSYTFNKVKHLDVPTCDIKISELNIHIPCACINSYVTQ